LFFAQSKKEEILILTNRIDSLKNAFNLEKIKLMNAQEKLKEDFKFEKSTLQFELNATKNQLESVNKSFHIEHDRLVQLQKKNIRDQLL
jgi:hypothetical protein